MSSHSTTRQTRSPSSTAPSPSSSGANIFHYHAQGYLTAVTSLKQVAQTFDEASMTLGASFLQTLRWVLLPAMMPALGSIAAFFFMRSMVTLSAVIFLVTPATMLAPVAVLQLDDAGYTSQAAALSMCIIAAVLASLAFSRTALAFAGRRPPRRDRTAAGSRCPDALVFCQLSRGGSGEYRGPGFFYVFRKKRGVVQTYPIESAFCIGR